MQSYSNRQPSEYYNSNQAGNSQNQLYIGQTQAKDHPLAVTLLRNPHAVAPQTAHNSLLYSAAHRSNNSYGINARSPDAMLQSSRDNAFSNIIQQTNTQMNLQNSSHEHHQVELIGRVNSRQRSIGSQQPRLALTLSHLISQPMVSEPISSYPGTHSSVDTSQLPRAPRSYIPATPQPFHSSRLYGGDRPARTPEDILPLYEQVYAAITQSPRTNSIDHGNIPVPRYSQIFVASRDHSIDSLAPTYVSNEYSSEGNQSPRGLYSQGPQASHQSLNTNMTQSQNVITQNQASLTEIIFQSLIPEFNIYGTYDFHNEVRFQLQRPGRSYVPTPQSANDSRLYGNVGRRL